MEKENEKERVRGSENPQRQLREKVSVRTSAEGMNLCTERKVIIRRRIPLDL